MPIATTNPEPKSINPDNTLTMTIHSSLTRRRNIKSIDQIYYETCLVVIGYDVLCGSGGPFSPMVIASTLTKVKDDVMSYHESLAGSPFYGSFEPDHVPIVDIAIQGRFIRIKTSASSMANLVELVRLTALFIRLSMQHALPCQGAIILRNTEQRALSPFRRRLKRIALGFGNGPEIQNWCGCVIDARILSQPQIKAELACITENAIHVRITPYNVPTRLGLFRRRYVNTFTVDWTIGTSEEIIGVSFFLLKRYCALRLSIISAMTINTIEYYKYCSWERKAPVTGSPRLN